MALSSVLSSIGYFVNFIVYYQKYGPTYLVGLISLNLFYSCLILFDSMAYTKHLLPERSSDEENIKHAI